MKIAITSPLDLHSIAKAVGRDTEGVAPGLGGTASSPIIIELVRRGHDVTVYTISNDLAQEEIHQWDNLRVFVGPSRQFGAARDFYRQEVQYLKRVIQADAPTFVNAHWTYEFAMGALAAKVPVLTTIHDLPWNVLRYFRDRCRTARLLLAYRVAFGCRYYTAVSNDAARHFRRYFRPGADITVVPNFLPEEIFSIDVPSAPVHGTATIFGTVLGEWSVGKNASVVLRAFALLRRAFPECGLLMIGKNYEPGGPAEQWARAHGVYEGVDFRGPLEHSAMLHELAREVDVLVHPSLNESFSMAAAEAMALKKPVIAGRATPGVREVLDFGRAGLLVDVRSPQAIADEMQALHTDMGRRQAIAAAGYLRVSTAYRSATVVDQYENVYRRFLEKIAR